MFTNLLTITEFTVYYTELMVPSIGKSRNEIRMGVLRPKYFPGQDASDYGLCDRITQSQRVQMDKKVWRRP